MSSPSKRHSHRHSSRSGGSGKKLRRLPKFSDNPPAQHEIVEKNDLLNALSGGGKKESDCDISSSDDTSPSKSNGHASVVDNEDKVRNYIAQLSNYYNCSRVHPRIQIKSTEP